MNDLRTAAQQALAFTMRDFASLRDFEAAKAVLYDILRAALAQQAEPVEEPPASKPWVGLTEKERTDICDDYGANIHWRAFRAIESKLQEKNT